MGSGLDSLRETAADWLREKGIEAVTAWPGGDRSRRAGAVAAVSLRACESGPGGFQDYLGERYDAPTATWRELYGKKLRVTVGLDLYAPAEGGEAACHRPFDRMPAALHSGGPPGLKVRSLSRGEGRFDEGQGLFCCPVEAVCEAWLYAETDGSGAFLRFEVKGERI